MRKLSVRNGKTLKLYEDISSEGDLIKVNLLDHQYWLGILTGFLVFDGSGVDGDGVFLGNFETWIVFVAMAKWAVERGMY